MKYKIADIPISVSGVCLDYVKKCMREYQSSEGQSSISIHCAVKDSIKAYDLVEKYGVKNYIEEYGLCSKGFIAQDREQDISYATMHYSDDFSEVECKLVDVEEFGGSSMGERMMVALGRCVLNCMPAFDALTFHSSCISYKDNAVLFAAPSGTGKSTQSGLWKKYYPDDVIYINDDTPILRKKDNVFHAFGTPWAGTSGINNNIFAPIKAIVYVKRNTECRIRRLSEQESIFRLMKSVRMQFFPVQRERQTKLLFELMRSVPVYELQCDISREAVEIVKSVVFGEM